MLNTILSLLIAAYAGAFYFEKDNTFLAIVCLITAFLFAIGYFDVDKRHEKSVK